MLPPVVERAAEVVNASVTATPVAPATRLPAAMVMDTAVGVLMPPLGAPADAASMLVVTVMSDEPVVVVEPMVSPESVIVKAAPAGISAALIVITIAVAVGCADFAVKAATDVVPAPLSEGVAEVAKNPEG